jgi:hypothetical protein
MANPPSTSKFDWKMYRYVPSLAGAIAALIIFSIMTLLHTWRFLKHRQVILIYVIIGATGRFKNADLYTHRLINIFQARSLAMALVLVRTLTTRRGQHSSCKACSSSLALCSSQPRYT